MVNLEREISSIKSITMPSDLRVAVRSIDKREVRAPFINYLKLSAVCFLLVSLIFIGTRQPELSDEEIVSLILDSEFPAMPDEIFDRDIIEFERIV